MITVTPVLQHFFQPKSIAIVGASNRTGKLGNLFVQRLSAGFRGELYPINPGESEIAGLRTWPSIAAIGAPIDLLITLVPADQAIAVVEGCRPGQVCALLAIPSGFAEVSPQGGRQQQKLKSAAHARGMRMIGPNTVGILNGSFGLNASMMPELPPSGRGLSVVTQSGGFGMALTMFALDHGMRIAKFCDLGNMEDVQADEIINFLKDDSDTTLVGLLIESIRDTYGFRVAVERLIREKPVILCAVGATPVGRRASFAHLGIDNGLPAIAESLPSNLIRVETGLDLLNAAKAIGWQKAARGRRAAVITGTGGVGAELADLLYKEGLSLLELSEPTQQKLREILPYYAAVKNPIDLTPIWSEYSRLYPAVMEILADSEEVDILILSITDVATNLPALPDVVVEWGKRRASAPIVVYWGARDKDLANMMSLQSAGIPCYRSTRETALAASALVRAGPGRI